MVKLRLAKQGRKKLPIFKLVAADARAKRDGRFIESLGQYRPKNNPGEKLQYDEARVMHWLRVGAQPTDTVRSLLSSEGILLKFHLEKKKIEPARAEEIFNTWKANKTAALSNKQSKVRESEKKKKAAAEAEKAAIAAAEAQKAAEAKAAADAEAAAAAAKAAEEA
ncbi:MAG TPA: 30S ribosomal protein S16, partial [Candidatus Kapabacteria bacterium]|nr:30S ribosomal protein S16 [Candidatus Kapabacteria bacterium]